MNSSREGSAFVGYGWQFICHHIHNTWNIFSKPFCVFIEDFYKDLHNNFSWSARSQWKASRDFCDCRHVCSWWKSDKTVLALYIWCNTLSRLQIFHYLTIFYCCYLNENDIFLYVNICVTNISKKKWPANANILKEVIH